MSSNQTIKKEYYTTLILPALGSVEISKYVISNGFMSVEILDYGATIVAINVPDSYGDISNIILGYDDILGYLSMKNPYFGATIGRYAQTVSGAAFTHNETTYFLSKNLGAHTYHGGVQGFNRRIWNSKIDEDALIMQYKSLDLEEGFPGDLLVSVSFSLSVDNLFIISYSAFTNTPTIVNITNQCYFNLAGEDSGNEEIKNHALKIPSDYYVLMDEEEFTPTGFVAPVRDTPYDFREFKTLNSAGEDGEDDVEEMAPDNLKIFYCIEGKGIRLNATMKHNSSGRFVQIYSNQPTLFVDTLNLDQPIPGRGDKTYKSRDGIAFQTGNLPDAVHHPNFPSPLVSSQKPYNHTVMWRFLVKGLAAKDDEEVFQHKLMSEDALLICAAPKYKTVA